MAQHWLAYHKAHSKDNPFPYTALGQPIVYMKKEFNLHAGDIIWMIQGEKVNPKETLFTLVDCFIIYGKITPPAIVSNDFKYAYKGKKSLLASPIEWDKTNKDWIVIHKEFLKKRPGLLPATNSLVNALKNISGITKF
ncbi:TPA: hypothetical protein JI109_09535 [Acinetobacter baumannii]|nr:hypothetical protein [Acinetobacter baumannii]